MDQANPDARARVKVLGERNSGTNFVEQVIKRSTEIDVVRNISDPTNDQRQRIEQLSLEKYERAIYFERIADINHELEFKKTGGWKHAALDQEILDNLRANLRSKVVCVVRNPFAWVISMHSSPYHALTKIPKERNEFIRSHWIPTRRDNIGDLIINSPLGLWNHKNRSYLAAAKDNDDVIIIRYEDIALFPARELKKLCHLCAVHHKGANIPEESARSWAASKKNYSDYRKRIEDFSLARNFSPEDIKFCRKTIDGELLEALYPEVANEVNA